MREMFSTGLVSYHMVVDESQFLYVGTITRTWSAWTPDTSLIQTHGVLEVEEALKGTSLDTLVLTTRGGTVDENALIVSDEPDLAALAGRRLIFRIFRWDTDRGDFQKGQHVLSSPAAMKASSGLLEHIRYILAGRAVSPVCYGETDFGPPTYITPASWGSTKAACCGANPLLRGAGEHWLP